MDKLDFLEVRFHYNGKFISSGRDVHYVGGSESMSSIERDLLSLPEIRGHLNDHVPAMPDQVRFHWLFPGKYLSNGLRLLSNDSACKTMSDCVTDGSVVDIYVEVESNKDLDKSNAHNDLEAEVGQYYDKEGGGSEKEVPRAPSKKCVENKKSIVVVTPAKEQKDDELIEDDKKIEKYAAEEKYDDCDSSDSDYQQPKEQNSSGDESEAEELRKLANDFKRKLRAKKLGEEVAADVDPVDVLVAEEAEEGYATPYFDSSEDYSDDELSDGQGGKHVVRRKSNWPRFERKAEVPRFALGMVFRSREQMKKALIKYGLKTHRHLLFDKDEKGKLRAKCSWQGCNWMIYGSQTSKCRGFQVATFVDDHQCPPRRDNKLVTAKVIAERYGSLIKSNPSWKLEDIKQTVLKDLLADVSLSKCKRAKNMVMQKMLDATKGEYTKVFDYQLELLRSNPGSTVAVALDPEILVKNVFQRFYVCFDACKKGFLAGCRRVIGLDGCFFKGACNGELLCAIGRDANNQMYPIAWAVVEKENNSSWSWFVGLLIKDLNINDQGQNWVFISDQQKGLLNAIGDFLPKAEHRMCARHIYANWKKKNQDKKLQRKFWRCAKASSRTLFNYYRAKLIQHTPQGAKDMMSTDPTHWSRAYFKLGSKCDSVDNNMCESFNNSIMASRYLPIISMLEAIRCRIMVRIQENRTKSEKWVGRICPNIFKKLKLNITRSGQCHVLWNGKEGFEVKEKDKMKFTVNLEKRTCSCRYWDLSGLPCAHAISAIYKSSKSLDEFIDNCYSIEQYHRTYDHCLEPVQGEENWPTSDHPRPSPPGYIKMPGRPKTKRRREAGEPAKGTKLPKVGNKVKCSRCHQYNHNSRSCDLNPNAKQKKNAVHEPIRRATAKKRKQDEAFSSAAQSKNAKAIPQVGAQLGVKASSENITSGLHCSTMPSHCVVQIGPRQKLQPFSSARSKD